MRTQLLRYKQLPSPDTVRIEELVNFFDYGYAPPANDQTFAAALEVAGCPWNPEHRLARIGIQAKKGDDGRPPSNLVFLLDVSGSMNRPNKMPVLIQGMKLLFDQLDQRDSIAIVVYAGATGLVLDSTPGDRKKVIFDSLNRLRSGGPTNRGRGIQLAYKIAQDHYIDGGTNRVILCNDGDFNVGVAGIDQLAQLAKENAAQNIFLTVLGFGSDRPDNVILEQISGHVELLADEPGDANEELLESAGSALRSGLDHIPGPQQRDVRDGRLVAVQLDADETEAALTLIEENRVERPNVVNRLADRLRARVERAERRRRRR